MWTTAWHTYENPYINVVPTPHKEVCHLLQCARKALGTVWKKNYVIWQFWTTLSSNKKNQATSNCVSSISTCLMYFVVFHHGNMRPLAGRLPVASPWATCCALESTTSNSATLRPRSAIEQRRRLSLANPICSSRIVTFKGSTSWSSGRGQAVKMQSIGCQS